MENLISTKTKYNTSYQAVIVCFILTTYCKIAFSMWIWTEGCVKYSFNTKLEINLTDNLPSTCFTACGEDSSRIALKGDICRCDVQNDAYNHINSKCNTPCDLNDSLDCGSLTEGYWSIYRKASGQELAEHNIPVNASGCVVHHNRLFSVDNCNRTGLRSLCFRAFLNKQTCSDDYGRWSSHACTNTYDRLLSTFKVTTYECSQLTTWIGLFSFEEGGYLNSSRISAKAVTVPSSSVLKSPSTELLLFTETEYIQTETTLETIFNMSTLHAESFNISTLPTKTVSLIHAPSNSAVVSVTEYIRTNTFPPESNNLRSSFTTISPVHGDPLPSTVTTPLSHVPILSQSVTYTSHSSSVTATVRGHSTVKMKDKSLESTPALSMSVSTRTKYHFVTNSIPSKVQPKDNLYTGIVATSFIRPAVSSQIHKLTTVLHVSSTTESVKDTKSATTKSTRKPPGVAHGVNKQVSSSRPDLLIAVSVIGAVAVFALVILGFMAVYVKRSFKDIRTRQNMTTFTGEEAPSQMTEELSQISNNTDIRADTNSEYTDTEFCRPATRANLRAYSDRPPFLFNGTAPIENEYVLY